MYSLDQGRFTVAAGAVGVIRACLEASVRYAREREAFGSAIGRYQFVQGMIADMVVMYEQARLLVWSAAHAKNKARETGARTTRETSMAKMVATEYAFKAADLAVQVHGAYGYSAEYPVERYLRNARAPRLYEGTTEIHRMMLAEDALGYRSLDGRK
jgi:glutaryl-CoA dehydrogenase (non-decarboxylating)